MTSALGNRGPPSNGIYWFKSKGDGIIIKVVVPKDSNAPFLQRRLGTNLSKLQSNLKAITENSRYAATAKTLFHAKFVDAPSTWADHVAAAVIAAADSFLCVPKPAKENKPPPPAAEPPPHKKAANGNPRVLTFPSTPTTPANQSIQRAVQLVLHNPELTQQQIHLGSYCDRMYRETHNGDSILGVPSSDLTAASKAAQKLVLTPPRHFLQSSITRSLCIRLAYHAGPMRALLLSAFISFSFRLVRIKPKQVTWHMATAQKPKKPKSELTQS